MVKLTSSQREKLEQVLQESIEAQAPPEEVVRVIYNHVFDRTFILSRHMLTECLKLN